MLCPSINNFRGVSLQCCLSFPKANFPEFSKEEAKLNLESDLP